MSSLAIKNSFGANTLEELFIGFAQKDIDKTLVAKGFCNVDTRGINLFHNPTRTTPVGYDGTAQNSYATETFLAEDDTLTPRRRAGAAEHVDSMEEIFSGDVLVSQRAGRMGVTMAQKMDRYILGLPVSMSGVTDIDDGYMSSGISNGTPFAATGANINDVANAVNEALLLGDVDPSKRPAWVVSPVEARKITEYRQANGFSVADSAINRGMNGFTGQEFGGLDLYVSNNLTHTVVLTIAVNPTATDTMSLLLGDKRITFTFVANGTAANPGEISIGASAAATQAIVKDAINGTGTPGASTYIDLSASDRAALKRQSPLSNTTSTACGTFAANAATITLYTTLRVSETFTSGSNVFGTVARHTIATVRNAIFLAMPAGGMIYEEKKGLGVHGKELSISTLYDATIWRNDKTLVKDVVVAG